MILRRLVEPLYERHLARQCRHIPQHIAIIQDGNRRYARMQGRRTEDGHRAGAERTEELLEWARNLGIRHITLYSFSTENFARSPGEVEALFTLFKDRFSRVPTDERVHRNRMRVQMVGDRSLLPPDLLSVVERAEESTKDYDGFFLNVALAYGGRNEIVRTARSILEAVREGDVKPGAIDSAIFERHLNGGKQLPPVDLIIRTGNEFRTSNFLPWLANGHECAVYFCAPYWPLFRKIDFYRAIRVYSQRAEAMDGR